jgi:hypothetical protein
VSDYEDFDEESMRCEWCDKPGAFEEFSFGRGVPECDDCSGLRRCMDDICHGMGYCMHGDRA